MHTTIITVACGIIKLTNGDTGTTDSQLHLETMFRDLESIVVKC